MNFETSSTFDTFHCSNSSQTFTSHTKGFTFFLITTNFAHLLASNEARKYENSRKILNEPPQQRTARRIFHKIQFHEVFIRREISEMEIFPSCRSVCVKKNLPQHCQRHSRKCDSAIPEFLCLSVCAVCLSTRRFYNERKIMKILASPTSASKGLYSFGEMTWIRAERGK